MKIHIAILAAGQSLRFGKENKLSEQVGGRTLLSCLLFKIQKMEKEWKGCTVLVYSKETDDLRKETKSKDIRKVHNPCPQKGISYSVFLALEMVKSQPEWKEGDAVCFCVCDQPFLREKTLSGMLETFQKSGKGIGCLYYDGMKNPCVFREAYFQELYALRGDTGGKKVIKKHKDDVFCYPAEKEEVWDMDEKRTAVIRGGGDLASGTAWMLHKKGYRVLVLETGMPACIRRQVAFCQAVFDGTCEVEGVCARRADGEEEIRQAWKEHVIPVAVDETCACLGWLKPMVLIDAILAKRNLGTKREMAPLTIGFGPGFTAGKDVDLAVETMRGDTLAKIYDTGSPLPNTGIPGLIAGYGKERVIHAPADGKFTGFFQIGDKVTEGGLIAKVGDTKLHAPISGFLRGMIHENYPVKAGLKIMDIEPRLDDRNRCFVISDKAKKIGESVCEAIEKWEKRCCENWD